MTPREPGTALARDRGGVIRRDCEQLSGHLSDVWGGHR